MCQSYIHKGKIVKTDNITVNESSTIKELGQEETLQMSSQPPYLDHSNPRYA